MPGQATTADAAGGPTHEPGQATAACVDTQIAGEPLGPEDVPPPPPDFQDEGFGNPDIKKALDSEFNKTLEETPGSASKGLGLPASRETMLVLAEQKRILAARSAW